METVQSAPRGVTEIRSLTGLRGVAAIYVVPFHLTGPHRMTNPALTFLAHGYLAVDLFFVLSGFVMALNYGATFASRVSLPQYKLFLLRRIARIYPLYLLTAVIGTLLVVAHVDTWNHPESFWPAVALNFAMVMVWVGWPAIVWPAWSISAEWFSYLVFPVVVGPLLFRSKRWAWLLGGVCAAAVLILCRIALLSDGRLAFSDYLALVRCVSESSLGVLAYRLLHSEFLGSFRKNPLFVYGLPIVVAGLLAVPGSDPVVILATPLLILCMSGHRSLIVRLLGSRPFEYLGQLSFSIYLLHNVSIGLLDRLHAHLARTHAHSQTYLIAIVLPALIPLSMLTYHFVEVPGRRLLRRWSEPASQKMRPMASV